MNLLLLILPLATELLDLEMTSEERRKTGIHKLSEKQKGALQLWIDNHYEKRSTPLAITRPETSPTVTRISYKDKDTIIHLSDETQWHIKPKDAPIAQAWINPEVGILIHASTDPNHPALLTNTLTGSSVCAKKFYPEILYGTDTIP